MGKRISRALFVRQGMTAHELAVELRIDGTDDEVPLWQALRDMTPIQLTRVSARRGWVFYLRDRPVEGLDG